MKIRVICVGRIQTNQFYKCIHIIRTSVHFPSCLYCLVWASLTCWLAKQWSFRNKAVTRKRSWLHTYLKVVLKRNRPPDWGEDTIVDWIAGWKGIQELVLWNSAPTAVMITACLNDSFHFKFQSFMKAKCSVRSQHCYFLYYYKTLL